MSNEANKLGLGQIVTTPQEKDAIHIAVAPVVAGIALAPGYHVGLNQKGEADLLDPIGVVDPFLKRGVAKGETFWLYLYPGTIKSLRHEWEHPAFKASEPVDASKQASLAWMQKWANKHMGEDYYGEGRLTEEAALARAISAGEDNNVGPYEDARDHIDGTWWTHWEIITGKTGERGSYFSCSC